MSKNRCPECGSSTIHTERRPDGFHHCINCWHRWKIGAKQLKQSVFDTITTSPETPAPKLVYRSFIRGKELRGNGLFLEWKPIKIKCYKSKVIPGVHYKNSTEAIAATVEKLKEVCDARKGLENEEIH